MLQSTHGAAICPPAPVLQGSLSPCHLLPPLPGHPQDSLVVGLARDYTAWASDPELRNKRLGLEVSA